MRIFRFEDFAGDKIFERMAQQFFEVRVQWTIRVQGKSRRSKKNVEGEDGLRDRVSQGLKD